MIEAHTFFVSTGKFLCQEEERESRSAPVQDPGSKTGPRHFTLYCCGGFRLAVNLFRMDAKKRCDFSSSVLDSLYLVKQKQGHNAALWFAVFLPCCLLCARFVYIWFDCDKKQTQQSTDQDLQKGAAFAPRKSKMTAFWFVSLLSTHHHARIVLPRLTVRHSTGFRRFVRCSLVAFWPILCKQKIWQWETNRRVCFSDGQQQLQYGTWYPFWRGFDPWKCYTPKSIQFYRVNEWEEGRTTVTPSFWHEKYQIFEPKFFLTIKQRVWIDFCI